MLKRVSKIAGVAAVLLLALLPLKSYAEHETIETFSDSPSNISVSWENTSFCDGDTYRLKESTDTYNAVKMRVSYSNQKVREEGYAAGELIISVKGIGAVNRGNTMEAIVGADKGNSTVKERDWSYTWNRASDTYIFTNNEPIKPNSVFSGYFELVWDIQSRNSIHGYVQNGITAQFLLPEGDTITSNELSFTNETTCDSFSVSIDKKDMYSYEGLGISDPENYIYVKYNLGASRVTRSRGLNNGPNYIFDPDDNTGEGPIVVSPVLNVQPIGDGQYSVNLSLFTSPASQYVYVAYPKDTYAEQVVQPSIALTGSFYEGDDEGDTNVKELARADLSFTTPADFNFTDIPGDIYAYEKDVWYDKYGSSSAIAHRGGDLKGSKMVTGTTETFYLEGSLNVSKDSSYTLEMVDDFFYITQNNGNYRQLVNGDYNFARVIIPGTSSLKNINGISIQADTYPVKVYAMTDGAALLEDGSTCVFDGVITKGNQTVSLPANTTTIAVCIEGMTESISSFSIPVDVNFHLQEEGLAEEEQSNLTGGQVVNTTFIRIYDKDGDWFNSDFTEDNYFDVTNINLAQKDLDIYGSYLDRERDNITFYPGDKSDYRATTSIEKIQYTGRQYTTSMTMGATFNFEEEELPEQYSLYTILPDGVHISDYEVPENFWDSVSLTGMGLDGETLAAHCTPDIDTNYKGSGRTYIGLHFDFSGMQISSDNNVQATIQLAMDKSYFQSTRTTINVRSNVIIDREVDAYTNYKYADNGSWGDDTALFNDIDNDGDSDELMSYNYDYTVYIYADSSQFQITKSVKTGHSDGYVQLPDVPDAEYGSDYSYRLTIRNGNNISKNIVISDILEVGQNAQWKGTFQSVDLSSAEKLGLQGTIWYSNKMDPGVVGGSDWTTSMNASEVKAVAVDFGDGELKEGKTLNLYIHMSAPTDTSLKNQITENGYQASLTMVDLGSGNETKSDRLESNLVQVKLTPALRRVIVTKEDAENAVALQGAEFQLISKETNEVIATATSNIKGYATFNNIPDDVSYILRETTAPQGYELGEDQEITFNHEDYRVTVKDPRKKGSIDVIKSNALDGRVKVEGAEYTLYDGGGKVIQTTTTDESGKASFTDLAWGYYEVKETKAPTGYQLNEEKYSVEIMRENVETVQTVKTTDDQSSDVLVEVVKYEKLIDGSATETPISGCVFELVRKTSEGTEVVGKYVTDVNGYIQIGSDLSYGSYYFREMRVPAGYEKAENQEFTLSPTNRQIRLTFYDKRKEGSILMIKKDDAGNMVKDAEFELYDSLKETVLGTYTTDEYGNIEVGDLEWGTYYLKEKSAPEGYVLNLEWYEATVDAKHLQVTITCIDECMRGSIVLTKTDEIGLNKLPGAEYNLYSIDGTQVQKNLVTDENGEIKVEDLPWGSYYFKETKAPTGYALSDETIRFAVNALNAGVTQYLTVTDPLDAKTVTVVKKIKASDINFDNGNPTFLFKLTGTDVNGKNHTYYRMVVFDENYVTANTDAEGYVSQTVTFSGLTAGEYTATEEESSRYSLAGISDVIETK